MTNLRHERIATLCEQLKFARLQAEWPALAQEAARGEASFTDFLEQALATPGAAGMPVRRSAGRRPGERAEVPGNAH
jgi:hypothetical protein